MTEFARFRFSACACLACACFVLAGCGPDAGALLEQARNAAGNRDYAGAARCYAEAAEVCTNAAAYIGLTVMRMKLGDPTGAEEAARAALAKEPESAEARLAAGQVANMRGDSDAAVRLAREVADAAGLPASVRSQAWSDIAVVEIQRDRPDAARVALFRARRLDPKNAAAWYHLGYLYRNVLHYDEAAREHYAVYARCSPADDPRALDVQRTLLPLISSDLTRQAAARPGMDKRDVRASAQALGEGEAMEAKNPKGARAKFKKACEADPLSYQAAYAYAKRLAKDAKTADDIVETLKAFTSAIDARPASRETYLAAARFATSNKRPIMAKKILSRALAHFSDDKTLVDLYVKTLRAVGEKETAKLYADWFWTL